MIVIEDYLTVKNGKWEKRKHSEIDRRKRRKNNEIDWKTNDNLKNIGLW